MNVCHEYFERKQIYHSYASRAGKGTHAAVKQAAVFVNKYQYYLKLDVKKFFDSISHDVLKRQLVAMFKEEKLLGIFYQIIDSYEASVGRGVPIGNLTSQYFANHILSVADHYVLEKLQNPAYIRYMDDFVIFNNDKAELLKICSHFENYLLECLQFTLKPICLNSSDKGLPFLGFLIFPKSKILLSQRSRQRFIKKSPMKLNQLENKVLSEAAYGRQMLALAAFTDLANSKNFRNFVYQRQSS